MKRILTFVLFFFCIFSFAQEVKVIEQNEDYIKKETSDKFEFINEGFDLTNCEKIVVLEGFTINSGKNTLVSLFNYFWKIANDYGANAYKIDKIETISGTTHIQISAYHFDEKAFEKNFSQYLKNKVYVFGDLDVKKGKTKKINLNKQKVELSPLEYISYQNEVGKYATVSIGGLLGAKVDIFGKEERLPVYLSLNGFRIGPGNNYEIGLSFNTGRIYPIDMNFGQFLINILAEKR